jgi:tetratricopeptide (TPR) repeat protein
VLSVSDVQWADPLVLELIDDLLDRLHRLPIVVLLTARPEVADRWQPRPGRHNLVVLNLDPLEAAAACELLGALLGSAPGDDVATLLIDRSGGNPFFIEELVALLSEAATVSGPSEALADLKGAANLPATLRGLVAARLDALPAEERGLLEDAAVLGRRGPVAALEALAAARGLPHVGPALEALEARDLIAVDNGFVGFGSDLVREVAYGILTKAERARRHARLSAWLDDRPTNDRGDELLEELARHAALAAELTAEIGHVPGVPIDIRDRAVTALDRAAARAEDRETHLVSARLYDQVLRLLGDEPGPERRHALVGRARARTALWQHDAARADLEAAMAEAREVGDEVVLARSLTVLGEVEQNEGDVGASMSTLGEAVVLWRRLGDRRGEASALRRQGMTSLFAGDPDAAEDSIGEALVAFQAIGSRKGIAWANQNLAWIAFTRGDVVLADERLAAAIALFGDIGDWGGLGWAQGLQAYVRYSQGGVEEAEAIALRVLDEAGERGSAFGAAMMSVLLASIRLWQGHAEEAVERASAAQRDFAAVGDVWGECRAIGPLSRALLVTGRRAEAEAAISVARELTDRLPDGSLERDSAAVMAAELAVHMGEGHIALAYLCGTEDLRSARGAGGDREVAHILGTALLQAGRFDDALTVLQRGAERNPGRPAIEASLVLARAALGQVAEARAAAAAVDAIGWATYLDRVVALLGLACAETRAGETASALAAVEQASALADATDDILTGGIVALARSRVLEAAGAEGGADVALAEADSRLSRIGIDAAGWDDLFRVATGTAAVA